MITNIYNIFSTKMIYLMGTILVCLLTSCDSSITIHVEQTVPPIFRFKRNASHVYDLPFFFVQEIAPENQNVPHSAQKDDNNKVIWELFPKEKGALPIENLSPIIYGIVPSQFIQTIPENNSPPPSLVEGKVYEAGGPSAMMPKGIVRFKIQDNKVILLPIPQS